MINYLVSTRTFSLVIGWINRIDQIIGEPYRLMVDTYNVLNVRLY